MSNFWRRLSARLDNRTNRYNAVLIYVVVSNLTLAFFVKDYRLSCYYLAPISISLGLLSAFGYFLYSMRRWRKEAEAAAKEATVGFSQEHENTFKASFALARKLFGPGSEITYVGTPEKYEMHIKCRHCGQMNRLVKRYEGAMCGSCKKFLRRGREDTVLGDKDLRESRLVN